MKNKSKKTDKKTKVSMLNITDTVNPDKFLMDGKGIQVLFIPNDAKLTGELPKSVQRGDVYRETSKKKKQIYACKRMLLAKILEFLLKVLPVKKDLLLDQQNKDFNHLTIISARQKPFAFDQVFNSLAVKTTNCSFFQRNISGLFDSISEVEKIEISSNYSADILEEEIIFQLEN